MIPDFFPTVTSDFNVIWRANTTQKRITDTDHRWHIAAERVIAATLMLITTLGAIFFAVSAHSFLGFAFCVGAFIAGREIFLYASNDQTTVKNTGKEIVATISNVVNTVANPGRKLFGQDEKPMVQGGRLSRYKGMLFEPVYIAIENYYLRNR